MPLGKGTEPQLTLQGTKSNGSGRLGSRLIGQARTQLRRHGLWAGKPCGAVVGAAGRHPWVVTVTRGSQRDLDRQAPEKELPRAHFLGKYAEKGAARGQSGGGARLEFGESKGRTSLSSCYSYLRVTEDTMETLGQRGSRSGLRLVSTELRSDRSPIPVTARGRTWRRGLATQVVHVTPGAVQRHQVGLVVELQRCIGPRC